MSRILKCDRCGELIPDGVNYLQIDGDAGRVGSDFFDRGQIKADLCPDCWNKLSVFLSEGKDDVLDRIYEFKGRGYWYITEDHRACWTTWSNTPVDYERAASGNMFETEAEADFYNEGE